MGKGGGGGGGGRSSGGGGRSSGHGGHGGHAGHSGHSNRSVPSSSSGGRSRSSSPNYSKSSLSKSPSSSAKATTSSSKSIPNKSIQKSLTQPGFVSDLKAKSVTSKNVDSQKVALPKLTAKTSPVVHRYFPHTKSKTRSSSPTSFLSRPNRARVIRRERQRLPESEYNANFPKPGLRSFSSLDSLAVKNYRDKINRRRSRSRSRPEPDRLDITANEFDEEDEEEVDAFFGQESDSFPIPSSSMKSSSQSVATSKMFPSPGSISSRGTLKIKEPNKLRLLKTDQSSLRSIDSQTEKKSLKKILMPKNVSVPKSVSTSLKDKINLKSNANSISNLQVNGSTTSKGITSTVVASSSFSPPIQSELSGSSPKDTNLSQLKTFTPFKVTANERTSNSSELINRQQTPLLPLTCRICLESTPANQIPSPNSDQRFVSPCRCRGQSKFVHLSCLREWLEISRSMICQVCQSRIRNVRVSMPHFGNWLFHEFAHIVMLLMFLTPLIFDMGISIYSIGFNYYWLNSRSIEPIFTSDLASFHQFRGNQFNAIDSANKDATVIKDKTHTIPEAFVANRSMIFNTQLAFQVSLYNLYKIKIELKLFNLALVVYGLPCTLLISAPAFIYFLKYCKQRMQVYQRENQQLRLPRAQDWHD